MTHGALRQRSASLLDLAERHGDRCSQTPGFGSSGPTHPETWCSPVTHPHPSGDAVGPFRRWACVAPITRDILSAEALGLTL